MKYLHLIWAALFRRKTRTFLFPVINPDGLVCRVNVATCGSMDRLTVVDSPALSVAVSSNTRCEGAPCDGAAIVPPLTPVRVASGCS